MNRGKNGYSESDNSSSELIEMREELAELRNFKVAFDLHKSLMTSFVTMIQRTTGTLLLRSMLRQTLEAIAKLTDSEESSLFWLSEEGVVTESILARGIVIREEKNILIGKVLEKGLAGWVYTNRQIGLVSDTSSDSRWLELPHQPYKVGSVLCIPIIRGKLLLAIITLMHSKTNHFHTELVKLIEICANQIALVLDQVRFYIQHFQAPQPNQTEIKKSSNNVNFKKPISDLALFIVGEEGRFIYVDQKLAHLLGYSLDSLIALGSLLAIATDDHREALTRRIDQCFTGENESFAVVFKGLCANQSWIKIELYGRQIKLFGKIFIMGACREF